MKVLIGPYPKGNKERKIAVRIDDHDVWSLDNTLALIIAPALKKLKENKHGAPNVDDDDVPMKLKSTSCRKKKKNEWDSDSNHFKRWDYVLDEMIFAFETINTDWDDQFWKVQPEMDLTEHPEDVGQAFVPLRWITKGKHDEKGLRKMQERISNGFRLFGRYYLTLWD